MLTELTIKNVAIIDFLSIDFAEGLTAFTGETGAGKSIIFDALELAMGERSDSSLVRLGEQQAEVTAVFSIRNGAAIAQTLEDMGIEAQDELYLRRVVNHDGRSKAYINGAPVAAAQLKRLRPHLVEIHGQNQHHSMSKPEQQLSIVDNLIDHAALLVPLNDSVKEYQRIEDELDALKRSSTLSEAELELLNLQISDLEQVVIPGDQVERLHQQHQKLAHADSLLNAASQATEQIEQDSGVVARLADALHEIDAVLSHDASLFEAHELIQSAMIQAQEAASSLNRYAQTIEVDNDELDRIDAQLRELHRLAKKYLCDPEELPVHLDRLLTRLDGSRDSESRQQALETKLDNVHSRYLKQARTLSKARQGHASTLAIAVTRVLSDLGMAQAEFSIDCHFDADGAVQARGQDQVRFQVRTNSGSAMDDMSKIASGGEMSRIALAIKVAMGEHRPGADLMIFDEVDTGTGGAIAQIIGEKLRMVASSRQVFCITHLAQVAACGHQQVRISKLLKDNATMTMAHTLDQEERLAELARMIGGKTITDQTRAHANELLATAQR